MRLRRGPNRPRPPREVRVEQDAYRHAGPRLLGNSHSRGAGVSRPDESRHCPDGGTDESAGRVERVPSCVLPRVVGEHAKTSGRRSPYVSCSARIR
jgi:hypothetical protein